MKQIAIREFQKRFYRVLDEELPVLITVTAKRKGEKVKTIKRCIVIPYDEKIEADYNKIDLYKKPISIEPTRLFTPNSVSTTFTPAGTSWDKQKDLHGNPITIEPKKEEKKGFFGLFKK